MRTPDRRELLALAPLALVFAGCAQAPASSGADPSAEAARGPAGTVFVLHPDVAAARDQGDVSPDESDAELVRRTGDVLLERLRQLASGPGARLVPRGERLELVLPRRLSAEDAAETARALTARGRLGIWIAPPEGEGGEEGDRVDLERERTRLAAWLGAHAAASLDRFNRLGQEEGGPDRRLRWCERPADDERFAGRPRSERCLAVLVPAEASRRFGSEALAQVYLAQDPQGYSAVGFEMKPNRAADFGAFTGANVDRTLAIVVDDVCLSLATINTRLPGGGIIMGRFTTDQAKRLTAQLRTGELPVPVELVAIR